MADNNKDWGSIFSKPQQPAVPDSGAIPEYDQPDDWASAILPKAPPQQAIEVPELPNEYRKGWGSFEFTKSLKEGAKQVGETIDTFIDAPIQGMKSVVSKTAGRALESGAIDEDTFETISKINDVAQVADKIRRFSNPATGMLTLLKMGGYLEPDMKYYRDQQDKKDWVQIAEQYVHTAPQMAVNLLAGIAGGKLGVVASSFAQIYGASYKRHIEKHAPEEAVALAFVDAIPQAALESLGTIFMLGGMKAFKPLADNRVIGRVAKVINSKPAKWLQQQADTVIGRIMGGMAMEGAEEYAQSISEIIADVVSMKMRGEEITGDKIKKLIAEKHKEGKRAALIGALWGGTISGPMAIVDKKAQKSITGANEGVIPETPKEVNRKVDAQAVLEEAGRRFVEEQTAEIEMLEEGAIQELPPDIPPPIPVTEPAQPELDVAPITEEIVKPVQDISQDADLYREAYLMDPAGRPEWATKTPAISQPQTDFEQLFNRTLRKEADIARRARAGENVRQESAGMTIYREYIDKEIGASKVYGDDFIRQVPDKELNPVQRLWSKVATDFYGRDVKFFDWNEKVKADMTSPLESRKGAFIPHTGTILIAKGDTIRGTGTMFHELTHDMLKSDPEMWTKLATFLKSNTDPEVMKIVEDSIVSGYGDVGPDVLSDEIVAKFVTDVMQREDAQIKLLGKIRKQDPSLFNKLFKYIKDALVKLQEYIRTSKLPKKAQIVNDLDAAIETVTDVFTQYGPVARRKGPIAGLTIDKVASIKTPVNVLEDRDIKLYSQLNEFIERKLPVKASPEVLARTIRSWAKKGGFKAEELEWSGLLEYLENPSVREEYLKIKYLGADKVPSYYLGEEVLPVVTQTEVMDYLKENEVTVTEVLKGADPEPLIPPSKILEEQGEIKTEMFGTGFYLSTKAENDSMESMLVYRNNGKGFIVGGDGLRDFVLGQLKADGYSDRNAESIAGEVEQLATRYKELVDQLIKNQRRDPFLEPQYSQDSLNIPGGIDYSEMLLRLPNVRPKFTHRHFQEDNVVAFVRFDYRRDAKDKEYILIQEMQSDWHQTGRKRGYMGEPLMFKGEPEGYTPVGYTWGRTSKNGIIIHQLIDPDGNIVGEASLRKDALNRAGFTIDRMVPDAPYKKTWSELAIKRMTQFAAEQGVDYISWVPGEAIQDRYNLSKHVDEVAYTLGGNLYAAQDGKLVIDESVEPEEIKDYIGDELAERLLSRYETLEERTANYSIKPSAEEGGYVIYDPYGDISYDYGGDVRVFKTFDEAQEFLERMAKDNDEQYPQAVLQGLDLKVGGEWAQNLYDKKFKNVYNKLFNKASWGKSKAEPGYVPTSIRQTDWLYAPIEGIAMWNGNPIQDIFPRGDLDYDEWSDKINDFFVSWEGETLGDMYEELRVIDGPDVFTKQLMNALAIMIDESGLDTVYNTIDRGEHKVWVAPITQEMKDKLPEMALPKFDIDTVPVRGTGARAVVDVINNIGRGVDGFEVDPTDHGTSQMLEAIGFERTGNTYTLKQEVPKNAAIIAGNYQAAWYIDLEHDGSTKKLYRKVSEQFGKQKGYELGEKELTRDQKKLEGYLNKSWGTYQQGVDKTSNGELLPTKNVLVRPAGIKSGKGRTLIIQISSNVRSGAQTNMGDAYFESLYSNRRGYVKPQDFWEAPEWAARVAYFVADADFYVARNLNEAKLFLNQAGYDNVVMSVMEDNKYYTEKILDGYNGKVVVGGYINPDFFKSMKNVTWKKDFKGLANQLGVPFKNGSDYRFFKGMQTIPRLELSRGCLHKCAFCDIPKKIEMATDEMIDSQIKGFKNMKYSLVYVNDKTFGQAKNFEMLSDLYVRLKESNPEFEGFIVQTTAAQYLKMDEDFLRRSGIKYVELGVETYNDKFLKALNKPHSTALIDKAAAKIRKLRMNFIPNVMVGLAGREGIDPKDMDQAYQAQKEENVWLRGSNRGKLAMDPKAKRGAFYFTKDSWYAREYGERVDAYVINVKKTWNPKDPSTMDEDIKAAMRKHSEFPGETGTAGPYFMHGDEMVPMGPTEAEQYGDWAVLEDKKIQKMLKERGYDSYMTSEGGGSIAVFDKKNISEYKPNIWNETATTYGNTLNFLKKNSDIISHVNIYSLATHEGTQLQGELQASEQDTDENILAKSWLKHPKVHEKFYQDVVNFGSDQLKKKTAPAVMDTDSPGSTISYIKPLEDLELFHGTGVTGIEKMSLDFLGTGEGQQAFGWGLYFTSKKEVANWYASKIGVNAKVKKKFGVSRFIKAAITKIAGLDTDKPISLEMLKKSKAYDEFMRDVLLWRLPKHLQTEPWEGELPRRFKKRGVTKEMTRGAWAEVPGLGDYGSRYQWELMKDIAFINYAEYSYDELKKKVAKSTSLYGATRGQASLVLAMRMHEEKDFFEIKDSPAIYQVSIPSGAVFMDWYGGVPKFIRRRVYDSGVLPAGTQDKEEFMENFFSTGRHLYKVLETRLGTPRDASNFLLGLGIHGIRFPIGSIHGKPKIEKNQSEHNFVLFDDRYIKIVAAGPKLSQMKPIEDRELDDIQAQLDILQAEREGKAQEVAPLLKVYQDQLEGASVDAIGEEGSMLPAGMIQVTVTDKESPAYKGTFQIDTEGDLQAQVERKIAEHVRQQNELLRSIPIPEQRLPKPTKRQMEKVRAGLAKEFAKKDGPANMSIKGVILKSRGDWVVPVYTHRAGRGRELFEREIQGDYGHYNWKAEISKRLTYGKPGGRSNYLQHDLSKKKWKAMRDLQDLFDEEADLAEEHAEEAKEGKQKLLDGAAKLREIKPTKWSDIKQWDDDDDVSGGHRKPTMSWLSKLVPVTVKEDKDVIVEGGPKSQSYRYAYYGIFDIAKAAKGMKNVRAYLAKQKTLNGLPVTPELVKRIGNVADRFYKDRKKANVHKRIVELRKALASGAVSPTDPEVVKKMRKLGGVAPYTIRHTGKNYYIGQKMRYGKFSSGALFDTDNDVSRETTMVWTHPVTGIEEKLVKQYDNDGNRLISGPIFSTDRAKRLDEIEAIVKKNNKYADWYERWRKFMFQFTDKGISEIKLKRIAAISGMLGAGKSPQTQQTIWAEVINQLESGHRVKKVTADDHKKMMDIWEGKEDEILGRTDDEGILLIQEKFGRKIGPYLAASIDPSSPNVLVLDRHMPKGWGYNVLATTESPQGGWNMHPSVEKEIKDDIFEVADRMGMSIAGVQAALWFDMRTPAADVSDIVKIAQIQPGQYVPMVMHKATYPEQTVGIHFKKTPVDIGEYVFGSDPGKGISPKQYSQRDLQNRYWQSTKNWPFIPAVYMYQPGVRPERVVTGSAGGVRPYSFKFEPREVYDASMDPYDFWGTAREEHAKEPNASLTNIFLKLVKDRGYKAVIVKSPVKEGDTWMMAFEKVKVDDPTARTSVGISDVVEGIEEPYESLEHAVDDMRVRGRFFVEFIKSIPIREKYAGINLRRYYPSMARFEDATGSQIELGLGLQLKGTLRSQRSFVSEIGIMRGQRYVYLIHDPRPPETYPDYIEYSEARKFEFVAKRKYNSDPDTMYPKVDILAKDMEAVGLSEFNLVLTPSGIVKIEQLVFGNDPKDAYEFAEKIGQFVEKGEFGNKVTEVHSEIFGNDDPELAIESYSKAIIDFWGKTKGEEIINEAKIEREKYLGQLREGTYKKRLVESKEKYRRERGFDIEGVRSRLKGLDVKEDIETEEIISGGHGVIKVTKAEHDFVSRFRLGVSHINSFAIDAYRIATGRPSETIGVYETLDELGLGWREELIDELGWSQSEADDLIDAVIYSANEVIRHNKTIVKQDIDTETKGVLDRIGRRDVTVTEKIREKANYKDGTLTTAIADKLHPLKMFAGAKSKAYMMHRGLPGVQSSINAMMEHGKLHLDPSGVLTTGTKDEGFVPWLKNLGTDAEKFFYWLIAKRDQSRTARDKKYTPMFTDDERSKLLNWTGSRTSKGTPWGVVNKEFQAFNNSVLKIGIDSGLLDPAMVAQFKDQFYVPFYRIFEDEQATAEFIKAPVNTKRIIAAQIKKLRGSKRKIGDPLENILANWAHLIKQSMTNQARKEAFSTLAENRVLSENGEPVVEEVPWKDTVIFKSGKDGKTTFVYEKQGIEVLGFKDGGKTKFFKVNDPELFQALQLQNNMRLPGWLAAILGAPKALLTFGATVTPSFVVANTTRDTLHTYTISKGFVPFVSTIKGFYKTLRKDQDFVEYMASGNAFVGSYVKADRPEAFSKYAKKILKREGQGAIGRILDTPSKIWGFWQSFTEASENATRLALYSDIKKRGGTKLEAAFAARDIMDFQKKGASPVVQYLTATVPFLNARIQGLYRMGEAMAENPKMYALKGASVALASIALWAAFRDDDRYKELEEWERFAYYHFWIGDMHYRIPKPFETGVIWSSAWTAAADVLTGNEEVKHIAGFIGASMLDTFAFNPVPQAARPILEQYFNKNFFTGRAIEPEGFKFRKPEDRFYPWDSESAQVIGKVLGVSPRRVQSLIRGYLAGLGLGIMSGADIIVRQFGDFPSRPETKIDHYPMIGRFVRSTPSGYTKYQSEFYDTFNELNMLAQTINIAQRDGEFKTEAELRRVNQKKLVAFNRAKVVKRNLARIRKNVHQVWKSDVSPKAKRERLDKLATERNNYVKEFYDWYLDNK
jgi:hypothetical protein